MKFMRGTAGKLLIVSCAALPGLAVNAQIDVHIGLPSVRIEAPAPVVQVNAVVPAGGIAIRTDADFEAPLSAYGRWDMVDGVRCWFPAHMEASWRPYSEGHWEWTDAGWYWVSDEPFGWATFHYGRWDYRDGVGWYWTPGVHWAPAWVAWRSGGGYSGWAPLPRAARFGVQFDVSLLPARQFCFVQEGHFTEPVRPTTVVVNNTTIINKTTIIKETRTVNGAVVHAGPPVARIERATGHHIEVAKATAVRARVETRAEVKPHEDAKARQVAAREQSHAAPARKTEAVTREENRGAEIRKNEAAAGAENRAAETRKTETRTEEETRARNEAASERKAEAHPEQTRTERVTPETERERQEKATAASRDAAKNPKAKTPPKKPTPTENEREHPQPEPKPQPQ